MSVTSFASSTLSDPESSPYDRFTRRYHPAYQYGLHLPLRLSCGHLSLHTSDRSRPYSQRGTALDSSLSVTDSDNWTEREMPGAEGVTM